MTYDLKTQGNPPEQEYLHPEEDPLRIRAIAAEILLQGLIQHPKGALHALLTQDLLQQELLLQVQPEAQVLHQAEHQPEKENNKHSNFSQKSPVLKTGLFCADNLLLTLTVISFIFYCHRISHRRKF